MEYTQTVMYKIVYKMICILQSREREAPQRVGLKLLKPSKAPTHTSTSDSPEGCRRRTHCDQVSVGISIPLLRKEQVAKGNTVQNGAREYKNNQKYTVQKSNNTHTDHTSTVSENKVFEGLSLHASKTYESCSAKVDGESFSFPQLAGPQRGGQQVPRLCKGDRAWCGKGLRRWFVWVLENFTVEIANGACFWPSFFLHIISGTKQ